MKLGVIYARARNGVIGKNNTIPWRLPEDMAHFKATTMGCPVVMGRKTWDSLPPKFRPLPGRRNVVITRQADWSVPGAERAGSLEEALALCAGAERAWVIGGAQIYGQSLPLADIAKVTHIDADYEGDAFMPPLPAHWQEIARDSVVSASAIPLSFVTYQNTHNSSRGD